ncbi:hypothetical protein CHS0354_002638 [Potamilus streckersoni]|uniref:NAD(P)-binding domain-containing protein n=1 Tax=Potamilus streckersoni TaxID=2493646 RepID=A0AAE0RNU2_9BIVA|nr:hypothetical protein CHS0354_002638 [Potamilus streckersoni]
MKIALLGATGPTGLEFVNEALDNGHEVIALVRNPEKITVKNENFKVLKVNILKEDELSENFKQCDAVVSCLGSPPSWLSLTTVTLYLDSIKVITSAMRKAGVKRLVCMSSMCSKSEPGNPIWVEWVLKPLALGKPLQNMAQMEDYLTSQCSDLDFTVVRPPGLVNGPSTGKRIDVSESQYVVGAEWSMPRRDVAKFMLSCVADSLWLKKIIAVGFPK